MGKGEGPGSPQGEGFAVAPARGGRESGSVVREDRDCVRQGFHFCVGVSGESLGGILEVGNDDHLHAGGLSCQETVSGIFKDDTGGGIFTTEGFGGHLE